MAKTSVFNPLNRVLNRQRSSEVSHILRIRAANSSHRDFPILYSTEKESLPKSENIKPYLKDIILDICDEYINIKKRVSTSDFTSSSHRKSHQNSETKIPLKEFYSNKINSEYTDRNEVNKKELPVLKKRGATRRQNKKNIENSRILSRKVTSEENHINRIRSANSEHHYDASLNSTTNGSRSKNLSDNFSLRKDNTKRTVSMTDFNRRRKFHQSSVSNESVKGLGANEKNFKNSDHNRVKRNKSSIVLKADTARRQNIKNEKNNSSKTSVVKNQRKINRKRPEIKIKTPERNKNSVQILNKTSNINMIKSADNVKSSSIKQKSKLPIRENEIPKEVEKSIDTHAQTQKCKTKQTEITTKDVPDVKMHVSDMGKLQVILDAKLILADDVAIVIWTEDIPKVFFTQQCPRPSLSKLHLQARQRFARFIKSQSESQIKDKITPKPTVHFSSFMIPDNLEVDSKLD